MSYQYQYVYGPVPSRRLGKSLGVSTIPFKTCTYSCIYCQLGRTLRLQTIRESFFPKDEILRAIDKGVKGTSCDYITFVGEGEPTLNRDIGYLINKCKERYDKRVAVITNGSLLYNENVRYALTNADVVISSLDADDVKTFKTVNRPHNTIDYDTMLQGQIDFKREYNGRFYVEVMLIRNINDSDGCLKKIKRTIEQMKVDGVYINVPIRPPAEPYVMPPTPETIIHAHEILLHMQGIDVEFITDYEHCQFHITALDEGKVSAEDIIMNICIRHPLRLEQGIWLERVLESEGVVERMVQDGKIIRVDYCGKTYLLPRIFRRC